MKKRSHRNTTRLTAKERATEVLSELSMGDYSEAYNVILAALEAHARETLARWQRRHKKASLP